jgi:hypothetical protein
VVYVFVPLSTLGFLIFASKVLGDFPIGDFQVQHTILYTTSYRNLFKTQFFSPFAEGVFPFL